MKNELTFKTFLESVFKKQPDGKMLRVDRYNIDRREQQFIQGAQTIIDNGFSKNFKECAKRYQWLFRGDDRYSDYFEEVDSFSLCYVESARSKDRLSTFSGSQFGSNLWHAVGLPSRRRCTMASAKSGLASSFGETYIVIPKDGTEIVCLERDWNLSFEKEIYSTFPGAVLNLGKLSTIFGKFKKSFSQSVISKSKYYDDFDSYLLKVTDKITSSIDDFERFFRLLELIILEKDPSTGDFLLPEKIVSTGTLFDSPMDKDTKKILEDLIKKVRDENADLLEIFEKLFNSFKDQMIITHDIGKILDSKYNNEVWWTGPTLVIKTKSRVQELLHYVKQIETGEIHDDGEPD